TLLHNDPAQHDEESFPAPGSTAHLKTSSAPSTAALASPLRQANFHPLDDFADAASTSSLVFDPAITQSNPSRAPTELLRTHQGGNIKRRQQQIGSDFENAIEQPAAIAGTAKQHPAIPNGFHYQATDPSQYRHAARPDRGNQSSQGQQRRQCHQNKDRCIGIFPQVEIGEDEPAAHHAPAVPSLGNGHC